MAMPHVPEFIRSFFSKVRNVSSGSSDRADDETEGPGNSLNEKLDRLLDKIPADRRTVLTMVVAVPVVLLLVTIGVLLMSKEPTAKPATPSASGVVIRRIPAEELFIPEEPDFVPGVILEREKRMQWSVDDATPWWQDPLKDGEQEWRDQIEKTVDEIMESVP
jgi:hypothetical protein